MAFGSRPRPFGFSSPLMSDPAGLRRQAFGLPSGFGGAPDLGVPQPPAINFGGPQAPAFGFGLPTARPVNTGKNPFDFGQGSGLGGIDDGDDDLGFVPLPPQRPDDASLVAATMEPNTLRRTAAAPAQPAPRETPDASALPITGPAYTSLAPSGSNAPAATALPAPAPSSPAPTSEPAPSEGIGDMLGRFRSNGGFDLLGSLGIGLLSSPTWAGGIATGLAYNDQQDYRRSLGLQQRADAALKLRKAQREALGENQTVDLLERNGVPRETGQAYVAAAAAGNRTALDNALGRISPKPADAGSGYTAPDPLTGRSSFIPGGSQDPATIAAQAQARHIPEQQLVDVPQADGSTVKTWLGKGAAAGVPVGAPKAAAPNVREFTRPDGTKGPYVMDPVTQQWREMDVGGGAPQTGSNPYATGRFTNEQGRAAGFSDRMMSSEGTLRATEGVNTTPGLSNIAGSSMYPNALKSDDRQKMEQAQRDFVNAQLRRESGAAISQKEFDNARQQYFPQPGDGEAVIAQKRQNRQRAIEAMGREGGPSYRPGSIFDKDGAIVPYQPSGARPGAPSRSALEAEARRRGLVR